MRGPAWALPALLLLLVPSSTSLSLPAAPHWLWGDGRGSSGGEATQRSTDAPARAAAVPSLASLLSPKSRVIKGIGKGSAQQLTAQPWHTGDSSSGLVGPSGSSGMDAVQTVFYEAALDQLRSATTTQQQQQQQQPAISIPHPDATASFDPDRARLLATLQSISYCADIDTLRDWTCTRCQQVPGFVTQLAHFDEAWDLSGYAGYLPLLDAKVLVFRGTDSGSWANCEWVRVLLGVCKGEVEGGVFGG